MKPKFLSGVILLVFGLNINAQEFKNANPKDIALFPQQNDLRNTLNISGIWKFKKDADDIGEKEKWFSGLKESVPIAVPGSWNEQFEDIRDYMGLVWYEQNSYVPKTWKGQR